MMRFFHPQMIAQCANKPGPTIDQMIDFVIAGPFSRAQGELNSFRPASRTRSSVIGAKRSNPSAPRRRGYGLLRRFSRAIDAIRIESGKWIAVTKKTCISTSRRTATASSTTPSTPSSPRARSGGFPRATATGNINLAPYSFFNAFCYHPPIIGFSSTNWKDSAGNIQDTGEFVWNLATMDLAKQMNATAAHVARDVDEFKIAGLTAAPCKLVNVPRVAESPVAFECKLTQIIQLQGADGEKAQAWLTLGEVVAVHIDKAFIQDGVYQTGLARPIVRAGRRGDYFEIKPENMFEMIRPD